MNPVSKPHTQARAEAAIWLARLRSDDRTVSDERAFHVWLAEDENNAAAFDAINAVWDTSGALVPERKAISTGRKPKFARRSILAGIGAFAGSLGVLSIWEEAYAGVYETDIGEQKHVVLDDGTQAFLDTNTRIRVHFNSEARFVDLERGRANFRVVPDRSRPFFVKAGGEKILANRTTFDARRDGDRLSVVLISGQAELVAASAARKPIALSVGERLVATPTAVKADKPNLIPLLAWQTGQAIFENEKLSDAIVEMNRYTTLKLVADDPTIAQLRLSGAYRVGDNASFARSVAALLPVTLEIFPDHVALVRDVSRTPQG